MVTTQTPSATGTEVPKPSQSVAGANSPSPNPTAVVDPTPPNRSRQNNRQLADKHYEKAQQLYHQLKYRAALRKCDEALALDPQHEKAQGLKREINAAIKILKPE